MRNLKQIFITLLFIAPFVSACSHTPRNEKPMTYSTGNARRGPGPQKKVQKPLIVLDPGHGGFDFGAQTHASEEKRLALTTSYLVKKILNDRGYPVMMTRTRDVFIPLKKRANIANNAKSAVFLSLHFNSAKNASAEGVEIYFYEKAKNPRQSLSKKLAQSILSSMLFRTGATSRGIKSGNFLVIRETNMPAILIEGGFMTNQGEGKKLIDKKYQEKIALAIADGVDKYFR